MDSFLSDMHGAFGKAVDADPLFVLLPLVVVAIAQGLRAGGLGQLLSFATRGLFWLGGLSFLIGGLFSEGRFSLAAWQLHLEAAWDSLMMLRFMEALGFWLLLFAISALVFVVRSAVRR